jgi:hypothetical protein
MRLLNEVEANNFWASNPIMTQNYTEDGYILSAHYEDYAGKKYLHRWCDGTSWQEVYVDAEQNL